jgi:hypothetical protein
MLVVSLTGSAVGRYGSRPPPGPAGRPGTRAWWSLRSLLDVRWLVEHGFDPFLPGCEVDVLRARL